MKKLISAGMLVCVGMLSGCASSMPVGGLYTELKLPVTSTGISGKKVGVSECQSILSLVAIGDCSIETAKKNGGITKVSNIDWEAKNILGLFGEYRLRVSGE